LADFTLGEYFRYRKFSPRFLTDYLAPMRTVIRSAPASETLDSLPKTPLHSSATILLQYDRPIWRTAKGAASELTAAFRDQLRLGCAVASIERTLLVATLSAVGVRPQVSWLREQALRGVALVAAAAAFPLEAAGVRRDRKAHAAFHGRDASSA
jgi:hypothetical protein